MRASKFIVPRRTSSNANRLTEIHEIKVDKPVRRVKRTITMVSIEPPDEITMESPPAEAENARETK
jgi:hypothetical protein